MKFTKMHGTGNDFIIINNMEEKIPLERLPRLARRLCARRLSIGADGLMVVEAPAEGGDYRMLFYNADGSLGEMCGNGIRCLARYAYENKLAGETQKIETAAGLAIGSRIEYNRYRVKLSEPSVVELDFAAETEIGAYRCGYVELGDPGIPHLVIECQGLEYLPDVQLEELSELGRRLRYSSSCPKGANVNFYSIRDRNWVTVKTFERGVEDFTLSCGTGSVSVALVLALMDRVDGNCVNIQVPGGQLTAVVNIEDGKVLDIFLEGPAVIVAEGNVK